MFKRFAKKGLLSVTLLALILSAAACGGGGDRNNNAADSSSTNSPKNSANETATTERLVELSLWTIWVNDESKPQLDQIKAFEESHPNIKINMEAFPHDQYKVKVKTSAAGKQLPDIYQVWPGAELEPLVNAGVIAPIDDIIDNWKDKIIPADLLTAYAIDGKQYAVPGNQNYTHTIYYDKDQVAQAGFNEFPTTYADFKTLISKLNENKVTPIVLGNKGQWVLQSCYISTIGDRFTGANFLADALSGKKQFTDPQFVKGLSVIEELAKMNAFNSDMNSIDNNQQRDVFLQGKAAMFIEGSWAIGDITAKSPADKNIGIAFFPSVEGGDGKPNAVSSVVGTGLGINSNLTGEEKAAAEEFMKFFYNEDFYKHMMQQGVVVPANVATPDDIPVLFKEFVSKAQNTSFAPVYDAVLPAKLTDTINNGLQALTFGAVTPEQLAEDMQKANK